MDIDERSYMFITSGSLRVKIWIELPKIVPQPWSCTFPLFLQKLYLQNTLHHYQFVALGGCKVLLV